jgi:hypothetical protein
MCVIGGWKRSRAVETTPRSSQFERSQGWVETMISSAPKLRSASSIAHVAHLTACVDTGSVKSGKALVEALLAAALAPSASARGTA